MEEKFYRYGKTIIVEAFLSLRQAIDSAIKDSGEFGDNAYAEDFSDDEVIVSVYSQEDNQNTYYKIPYKISDGGIEFTGDAEEVEKKVIYEKTEIDVVKYLNIFENDKIAQVLLIEKKKN